MPPKRKTIISPSRIREQFFATRTAIRDLRHNKGMKRVLGSGFETKAMNGLLNQAIYSKMPKKTLSELQNFLHSWIDKRAKFEVKMDKEAKQVARKEGVTESRAYFNVLEQNRKKLGKMLETKASVEQLLFIFNHQRSLKKKGRKIDTVAVTKTVREFGKYFKGKDKPTSFKKLAEAVSRIPMINVHPKIARAYYGLPTAEETLMVGRIQTVTTKLKGTTQGESIPAWGCGMQCDVINAVLNSWKWENYQVRTRNTAGYPHSVVLTKVPGTEMWLVADPFIQGRTFIGPFEKFKGSRVVAQVGLNLGNYIKELEAKGSWKKGKSLKRHVKNFEEYERGV